MTAAELAAERFLLAVPDSAAERRALQELRALQPDPVARLALVKAAHDRLAVQARRSH